MARLKNDIGEIGRPWPVSICSKCAAICKSAFRVDLGCATRRMRVRGRLGDKDMYDHFL